MPKTSLSPQEWFEQRASVASHLDDARGHLIEAAKGADGLPDVHLDVIGSIARLDDARARLVGGEE